MEQTKDIKLTQYSHGGGCGCKIAPGVLRELVGMHSQENAFKELLVGNETADDAAVYDLGNGQALISTVDFFMPIVDDAYAFGMIAAANSLSDVYAMGGKPIMALAVLGWPVEKLPPSLAAEVMRGAKEICAKAGIPIAGGHTIDSPEPFFGLSVNGIAEKKNIRRNCDAKAGDVLFLTKPLGLGILTTAGKRGLASSEQMAEGVALMTRLNDVGESLGKLNSVHAMTDVTGFGFLGHLLEMCEGSGLSAMIRKDKLPFIPSAVEFAKKMIYPDSTFRNWKSFDEKVDGVDPQMLLLLSDPQTSGGLLIAAAPDSKQEVADLLKGHDLYADPIGEMTAPVAKIVSLV